ncbi:MAG: redoxin family protein [Puniceicoccales bacterium]|jgi:thiol-disulfide isomerase/thioredoxin|nr:redoxin family protein [Puniceicoccales bacterium]
MKLLILSFLVLATTGACRPPSATVTEKGEILKIVKERVVKLAQPASDAQDAKPSKNNSPLKSASDEVAALESKKYLFLYFSAHWCPPCRQFTPKLVDFYNKNAKNGDFDLIFVSADRSIEEMADYMSSTKMPWFAIPPKSDIVKALGEKFKVEYIPHLVLLGKDGEVLAKGKDEALQKYLESHPVKEGP